MDDFIKRADALKVIETANSMVSSLLEATMKLCVTMDRIAAADVAPVRHGLFLGTEYDGYADGNPVYYEWQCSVCGCIFEDDEPTYNFCPYCGAKMDMEAE